MDLVENLHKNVTTITATTGAGCTPINLQPVPLWFVAFLIGPVFLAMYVRVLHKLLVEPWSPLHALDFAQVYASLDAEKQKKFRMMVVKGTCSTAGFATWMVIALNVFKFWGEPVTWITESWAVYFRGAAAILTSGFLFEICYSSCQWDTWFHHVGAITLQVIVLCQKSNPADEPIFLSWATLYQLSTSVDMGIFWGMACYYVARGDTLEGLTTKLRMSQVVFSNLMLTVLCMNGMPLALTISQWNMFVKKDSRFLLLASHLPFLPDQLNSVRKCYQIVQHNAKRVAKASKATPADDPVPAKVVAGGSATLPRATSRIASQIVAKMELNAV